MFEIIPSVLVEKASEVPEVLTLAGQLANRAQVDIADGIFVPHLIPVEPDDIAMATIAVEVHLMVSKPENHIQRWLDSNADRIVFHVEATQKHQEIIETIIETGKEVGLALNPKTPISVIEPLIDLIDYVQFMTVEPGFSGAPFVPEVLQKIKDFAYYYPDLPIQVDGSVNLKTAGQLAETGVTRFVVGSYLMKAKDPQSALRELQGLLENIVK